jgi:hypothetical protein
MTNINLEHCEELIEFIDKEMRIFEMGKTEDYDYERDLFIRELSYKVKAFIEKLY